MNKNHVYKSVYTPISERQALILKCLDVPLLVEPKKVQAKLIKKRSPKPKVK